MIHAEHFLNKRLEIGQFEFISMHQVGAHALFIRVISRLLCVFGTQMRGSGNPVNE